MKTYKIACIPGDGIGKEVVPAGQAVLQALAAAQGRFAFDFTAFDWGGDYYRQHGVMMPADGLDALRGQEQLQATLFRAAVLCGQDTLTTGDFPQICASLNNVNAARHPPATARAHLAPLQTTLPVALFDEAGHIRSLQEVEADLIRLAVRHYHGHMTEVARRLGIMKEMPTVIQGGLH